jgi:hypothetical protein
MVTPEMPVAINLQVLSIPLDPPILFPAPHTATDSLQFAALTTRPDIAYAVNYAAQFKNHPTPANCNAVRRILKYLRGTSNFRIQFSYQQQIADIMTKALPSDQFRRLRDLLTLTTMH